MTPGQALPPLPPRWTGKFTKRPVTVEAVQLTDDDGCDWDSVARWCGGRIYNIETSPGAEPQTLIDIPTLEGTMTAGEGWWIVKGVKGEFYPVRPDIFEATYEPAGAAGGEPSPELAIRLLRGELDEARGDRDDYAARLKAADESWAKLAVERDGLRDLLSRYERITTAWTRGMYAAWIDCVRGDVKAAIECLSEGLDGYDGTEWNGTETGAEWWERTKAEEGL